MSLKITAVTFSEGINKLGGRMGMTLVPNPTLPYALALEASTHGLLVTFSEYSKPKIVLVPWHKISCCDVEIEEAPKPQAQPPPSKPTAKA